MLAILRLCDHDAQHGLCPRRAPSVMFVLLVAVPTFSVLWRLFFHTSPYPLPPRPRGEPVLGHIRLVPTENPHLYYQKLAEEYDSDILVPLRKAVWSNIETYKNKKHARLFHTITQRPEDWEVALRRFASAIVLRVAFGIALEDDDDEYIKIAADAINATGNGGSPGATIVDYLPFLGHLPYWMVPSQAIRHAKKWGTAIQRLHDIPFAAAQKEFNDGRAPKPSYVSSLLEKHAQNEARGLFNDFSLKDINGSAAAVFIAGSDTTFATTLVGILNLLLHPAIFHKARELLDQTIGPDRLPSLKDRDNPKLLYLEHIVQEIVRWRPLSPLGVPHKSLHDDVYNDMFIPRGTSVYFNTWAMSRDRAVYRDPDLFNPARYLPAEHGGAGEPYLQGPFGFGRRVCVGRHLALASVWIVLATLLATVDLAKPVDPHGRLRDPVVAFTTGLSSHPLHFDCRFRARSRTAASLLASAVSRDLV
ncbi:hypothetical protein EYC84_007509 [Monilinia fructicola]|uniref:Cytochrome P450 n=1 Tax=Monilinia fructicola TaxID=38448 RepID=A0A5M9JG01_MONFR|nr:hypothetical protein EYC84_007509 [Monilinia fructicola]